MSVEACVLQLLFPSSTDLAVIRDAVAGGVDLLQVRDKHLDTAARIAASGSIVDWAQSSDVPILINDDPDAASALRASGVHLGQEDPDPAATRQKLGPDAWIGWSTHDFTEATTAPSAATHLGIGACYRSGTKSDTRPLSEEELRRVCAVVDRPVFAIGGIGPENLERLIEVGVRRIAVSACILSAREPGRIAEQLRRLLSSNR